jgi:hypothetical protein
MMGGRRCCRACWRESDQNDSELSQRLRATIEGDLTLFDLKEPDFD